MLHKSKGVYRWQNKATYCVSWGLSPVILAYLKQLLKNKDSDGFGVPSYFCHKQAEVQGLLGYTGVGGESPSLDVNAAHLLHIEALSELVWAFSQKGWEDSPKMEDYGLDYTITPRLPDPDTGLVYSEITHTEASPTSYADYKKASDEYSERLDKAFKLFGEIYQQGLDW